MPRPADAFGLGSGPDACLLLHGLTGAPPDMRPVGEALEQAGFYALCPLLPGHGTAPEDLDTVTRADLLDAARDALVSMRGARRIFLCGLSVGALLAVRLAALRRTRDGVPAPTALALLAPAVAMGRRNWMFTQIVGRLPALPLLLDKGGRDIQLRRSFERIPTATATVNATANPTATATANPTSIASEDDGSYAAVPWRWGRELRLLRGEALAEARRVRAPALILHGARDHTTPLSGAYRLSRELGSPRVAVRVFERSGHVLPLDVERAAVCAAVVSFFQEGEWASTSSPSTRAPPERPR